MELNEYPKAIYDQGIAIDEWDDQLRCIKIKMDELTLDFQAQVSSDKELTNDTLRKVALQTKMQGDDYRMLQGEYVGAAREVAILNRELKLLTDSFGVEKAIIQARIAGLAGYRLSGDR